MNIGIDWSDRPREPLEYCFAMLQPGANVLLISDDLAVRAEVVAALVQAGAGVKAVADGAAAVLLASNFWRPDVIVVDLLLSTRDSHGTYRALRTAFGAPIIVAAPNSIRFSGEVDDVLSRPVQVADVLRWIETRCGTAVPSIEVVRAGDLLLMPRAGKELPVSADELSLRTCLAANAGREVRTGELRAALRGVTAEVDPRMVDIHLIRVMVELTSPQTVRLTRTPTNDAYVLSVEQATKTAVPA